MVDEGMKKLKNWGWPESLEEESSHPGFPKALALCLIYDHLPILVSLIQERTVARLQGHQDGKSPTLRGHFCRSRMNFIHACPIFIDFATVFSQKSARALPLGSVLLIIYVFQFSIH